MRTLACLLIVAALLQQGGALAQSTPELLSEERGVWVTWNVIDGHADRSTTESATPSIRPGSNSITGLFVHNSLNETLYNVTLTVVPQNGSVATHLGSTQVEDADQVYYAFWFGAPPNSYRFAPLEMNVSPTQRTAFELKAVVTFSTQDRTGLFSITTLHAGIVEQGGPLSVVTTRSNMNFNVATVAGAVVAGAVIGALMTILYRRRRTK